MRVIAYRVANDFNRISTYLVDYEDFMNRSLKQSGESHNADQKYRENDELLMLPERKRNRKFTGSSSIVNGKSCSNWWLSGINLVLINTGGVAMAP